MVELDHWAITEQLTALLHATKKGNMELAKLLLQRGAEPNAKDEEQMTPLLYAAECNHELGAELGRLLLESKAEHNAKNKHSQVSKWKQRRFKR
eukprot:g1984.t1